MQSWSFSSVFIFMNLHSLQRQFSTGTGMKRLPGHSLRSRWIIPASVAIKIAWAALRRQ